MNPSHQPPSESSEPARPQRRATTTAIIRPLSGGASGDGGDEDGRRPRRPPTRRRSSQGGGGSGILVRNNSVRFRHSDPAWYEEDDGGSSTDGSFASRFSGLEVMDLRPDEAVGEMETGSLVSFSSSSGDGSNINNGNRNGAASASQQISPNRPNPPVLAGLSRFFQVASMSMGGGNDDGGGEGGGGGGAGDALPTHWKVDAGGGGGEGRHHGRQASLASLMGGEARGNGVDVINADGLDGFSSESSRSNRSRASFGGSGSGSGSSTSSRLWERIESSSNLTRLSMMTGGASGGGGGSVAKRKGRGGVGCSTRRFVRTMAAVAGAVAAAALVYLVAEEHARSMDLLGKLFANTPGDVGHAEERALQEEDGPNGRKLPQNAVPVEAVASIPENRAPRKDKRPEESRDETSSRALTETNQKERPEKWKD